MKEESKNGFTTAMPFDPIGNERGAQKGFRRLSD
jgi:hypothetical protein